VTLGITCQTMLRGRRRLRQCAITDDKVRAGIDREFRRVFAGRRDHLPDDAELADYEDDWGRRPWTQQAPVPEQPSGSVGSAYCVSRAETRADSGSLTVPLDDGR
jgi:hypothetical protein